MKVKLLNRAVRDLEEIRTYIATENPRAAKRVIAALAHVLELVGENPEIGHLVEGQVNRVLVVPRLPYVMPYRLRNSTVEILRVFHTRRSRPAKWEA